MEAMDIVSAVTVGDNVLHMVKDGIKFRSANFNFEELRDARCKSEFADDAVTGTLVDGGRGGGGWGAAGGSAESAGIEFGVAAPIRGGILGAAGGKAIKTNGHAVTWLSGANRAYGAIG